MAGSLVGAGLGLVGSMMSSRSADRASQRAADAARFDPWNTSGGIFGNASFQDGRASFVQSPLASGIQGALTPQLMQLLSGGGAGTQFGNQFVQQGGSDIMGAYGGAQGFEGVNPAFLQQYSSAAGQAANRMQAGGGALMGAGLAGLGGDPAAQDMISRGQGFLDSNYSDVAAERLGLLREQAAPFEERATDSLMGRLFGQGRMGSTGGGRDIEAFARGLGQADTSRQLDAQGFAEQLYSRDLQAGQNLLGGGLQALLASKGQAAGFLGQGADMFGGAADMRGNILNAQTAFNQFGYNRAQDRLQRSQDLFGFGAAAQGEDLNRASTMFNMFSNLSAEQRAQIGLGADMGKAQASAGANAGNFMLQGGGSPIGSFLGGLGQGVMTGSIPMPSFGSPQLDSDLIYTGRI